MSALPERLPRYRTMVPEDIETIVAIECNIYPHPWTRGNFVDSLAAGYDCRVLECAGEVAGYGVLMVAAGEAHLLNLSVARGWQRQGLGRALLEHFTQRARDGGADLLLLEVRPSNTAALALYEAAGLQRIGLRRGYYPAGERREDAVVMRKELT
jgi:ribosomal-protein-alanine N-acetyltransferase